MEEKKIERAWCICWLATSPIIVGKIEEEENDIVYVRYSESQLYDLSLWNKNSIKRFQSITEMIEYADQWLDKPDLLNGISKKFPSLKSEIDKVFFRESIDNPSR